MDNIMAIHAPIEIRENVRKPAICPLRFRSIPITLPRIRLSVILKIAEVVVSSTLEIICQKCSIRPNQKNKLFFKREAARSQTIAVGKEFHGVIARSEGGIDIPVNLYAGDLIARIFD